MQAILALCSYGRGEEAKSVARLFRGRDAFEETICKIIGAHFGIKGYRLPRALRRRHRR